MPKPDELPLDRVSRRYLKLADELRRAAAHSETAAGHFAERDVPRGCAHGMAVRGHLVAILEQLDQLACEHAEHSEP